MLTEDDEKEDIVVFVGRNAESYKRYHQEKEIGSSYPKCRRTACCYKRIFYLREAIFIISIRTEKRLLTDCKGNKSGVIYQANEAVALNGSYIKQELMVR